MKRGEEDCLHNTWRASNAPELTEVGWKLTGALYVQHEAEAAQAFPTSS